MASAIWPACNSMSAMPTAFRQNAAPAYGRAAPAATRADRDPPFRGRRPPAMRRATSGGPCPDRSAAATRPVRPGIIGVVAVDARLRAAASPYASPSFLAMARARCASSADSDRRRYRSAPPSVHAWTSAGDGPNGSSAPGAAVNWSRRTGARRAAGDRGTAARGRPRGRCAPRGTAARRSAWDPRPWSRPPAGSTRSSRLAGRAPGQPQRGCRLPGHPAGFARRGGARPGTMPGGTVPVEVVPGRAETGGGCPPGP